VCVWVVVQLNTRLLLLACGGSFSLDYTCDASFPERPQVEGRENWCVVVVVVVVVVGCCRLKC